MTSRRQQQQHRHHWQQDCGTICCRRLVAALCVCAVGMIGLKPSQALGVRPETDRVPPDVSTSGPAEAMGSEPTLYGPIIDRILSDSLAFRRTPTSEELKSGSGPRHSTPTLGRLKTLSRVHSNESALGRTPRLHRQRHHRKEAPMGPPRSSKLPNRWRRTVMRHQQPVSCFSCASEEYEPLYSRSDNLFSFGQPLQFDRSCDARLDLQTFAPAIRCDATCISVLEPQYFGGILNEQRPYSYVRGCATDIFAVANAAAAAQLAATHRDATDFRDNGEFLEPALDGPNAPPPPRLPSPEMERLYRSEMCVLMPIQDLWPELFPARSTGNGLSPAPAGELVKVCSCNTNACNTHDAADSGARPRLRGSVLGLFVHLAILAATGALTLTVSQL